ncbi:MAG: hypothetical protein LKI25_02845 [Atopobiaceae bacterium]|jgi:uncharacterized protein (DUF697 family)|nr:hypothetical protein [Atopobiaceae bacterium]MCI2173145.1 hypothetical protein [Atopobiaceae bacterium]MCI2208238.1 hypothetical protein [Atopobiaceae bacterium]
MASLRDIPVAKAASVFDTGRKAVEDRAAVVGVTVLVDPAAPRDLVVAVRDAFTPQTAHGLIHVAALDSAKPLEVNSSTDVAVVVAGGSDTLCGSAALAFAHAGVPCAIVAQSSVEAPEVHMPEDGVQVALVCASSRDVLLDKLARWICDTSEKDLAFAANFPFVRRPKAEQLVQACSAQNAAVGAMPFLKGADFPVMTANEAKMALEVAAIYGKDLSLARIPEIAFVIAGAFGLRGIARGASSILPGLDWALGVGVGYGGATAIGQALIARFEGLPESAADVIEDRADHVGDVMRLLSDGRERAREATAATSGSNDGSSSRGEAYVVIANGQASAAGGMA